MNSIVKVIISHIIIYLLTYTAVRIVDDYFYEYSTFIIVILLISFPVSFLANIWAVADKQINKLILFKALKMSLFVSPLSFMVLFVIYVNVVGYHG